MKSTTKIWLTAFSAIMLLLFCSAAAFGAEREWSAVTCDGAELNDVRNIVETNTGFWVCTKGGLFFVSNAGQVEQMFVNELKTQFVYDIAQDSNGNYYVTQGFTYSGGINYGLLKISADGELLAEYNAANSGLKDDFVQAVEIDAQGRVWVGSGTGLSCYTPSTDSWQTYGKEDGLAASSINTLVCDKTNNRMWLGHYADGSQGGLAGPFTGGWSCVDANGKISCQLYDAAKDSALNPFLLGDFWVRGIALDGQGGAYIIRSGAAPTYFENPAYVGADGQPISIDACMGGRLDYVSAKGAVTRYTGRQLSTVLNDGIKATDFTNNIPGSTPELRMVGVDASGGVWFGTSGAGVLTAAAIDGAYTCYNSANTPAFSNNFFDNVYALTVLSDGTVAVGSQGGLRLYVAAAAVSPVVGMSTHQVSINGKPVAIEAYNIDGNNYVKLRDLAFCFNGTAKQFELNWLEASRTINLLPQQSYSVVGGEMKPAADAAKLEVGESTHRLQVAGSAVTARAYNINGNNYFMLRDIGSLLDFSLIWDEASRSVLVNTAAKYSE